MKLCRHGHEMTPENTLLVLSSSHFTRTNKDGTVKTYRYPKTYRVTCRTCRKISKRKSRNKQRWNEYLKQRGLQ